MKKVIAILLAVVLMFPVLSMPVYAEDCQHQWSDWTYEIIETCGTPGLKVRECRLCGDLETKSIPATGKHEWDQEWIVIKQPTVFKEGKKEKICFVCDQKIIKPIKKLKAFAKFKKKSYKLKVGKTLKLNKKIKFAKGDKIKRWKSSNRRIAIVNSKGKVKAKRAGKTTITVKMKSGKKAKCKIVVKAKKKIKPKKRSGGNVVGGIVYWVDSGDVFHSTANCSTLSRSSNIHSGPLSSCPKSRPCKRCH